MASPLISVDELSAALSGTSRPVVLDVRWAVGAPPGHPEYLHGHIPGASFVDLDRELAAPPGPGRHPLPSAADFETAMRAHGVSSDSTVVVYDAGGGTSAARAWWLLRYFGHDAVRLLDGGFAAWKAAGLEVAAGIEAVARVGDFRAEPGNMPVLDATGAAALAGEGVLLDARAPERYRGDVEPIDSVAGHIPGARNLPTAGNLGADGRFLSADALRARFAEAAPDTSKPLGAYCGSGVTAAHEVLAAELAGRRAALYTGSWSEWITDRARPVATGEGR